MENPIKMDDLGGVIFPLFLVQHPYISRPHDPWQHFAPVPELVGLHLRGLAQGASKKQKPLHPPEKKCFFGT